MTFRFRPLGTLPDVVLIEPAVLEDDRGWFAETYRASEFREHHIPELFVQDNQSFSLKKGTLRGFHFQNPPAAQGKLVRVTRGEILDIVVDLRPSSPTYTQHAQTRLSEAHQQLLWIPPGFGHGVLTLVDNTSIDYKVTAEFSKAHDRAIRWNDPTIAAPWPIQDPILSPKDRDAPLLRDADNRFV